jgi:FeS assembly SUF system protein
MISSWGTAAAIFAASFFYRHADGRGSVLRLPKEFCRIAEIRLWGKKPGGGKMNRVLSNKEMIDEVVFALRDCYDPEIPVNIYDLGLIYDIKANKGVVQVKMTLTGRAGPAADVLPMEIEDRLGVIPGVKEVKVEIVWEPPWNAEMMSEDARLQLGL